MIQRNKESSYLSILREEEFWHEHSVRDETHPRKREPREDGGLQGAEGVTVSKLEKGWFGVEWQIPDGDHEAEIRCAEVRFHVVQVVD